MPPRIPRPAICLRNLPRSSIRLNPPSICLFCSQTPLARRKLSSKRPRMHEIRPRLHSKITTEAAPITSNATPLLDPRTELQESLRDLQKHASRFVNLSRLQLALHGLQQTPGDEAIRIAILGLADGGESLRRAKELLRLILADPLKTEEEWERILLEAKQGGKPLLLRVGYDVEEGNTGGHLVRELYPSSPSLKGHKLEILVLEMDPLIDGGPEAFAESVLVPSMEIPTSSTGRYTPVTTPVHKCMIVGEGIMGATSLAGFPIDVDREIIGATANMQLANKETSLPFQVIDIPKGTAAIESFRLSVDNALSYEQEWFASGLPELVEWIKSGTGPIESGMKEPVRKLVRSLLSRASTAIQEEQASILSAALLDKVSTSDLQALREALSKWAENAHTELRDQLDIAFDGNRWRKLSWWKLFWRVDDVSMIASDILNQRFLTNADKDIIFLAGRIAQVKSLEKEVTDDPNWAYKPTTKAKREHKLGYEPLPPSLEDIVRPRDLVVRNREIKSWPTHIPIARSYLALETIPALQALAQKLVLQSLSTSSLTSIIAGLMYVSTISTSVYEAGAVAALGIVWSMKRMQGKWEAARTFWEGEVREAGRLAVRGVERHVADILVSENKLPELDAELEKARELVERAEDALENCK